MAKIRVYELAKMLNMTNKALLGKLQKINISVKSHMSTLEDEHVELVKARIVGDKTDVEEEARSQPAAIRRPRKRLTIPVSEEEKPAGDISLPADAAAAEVPADDAGLASETAVVEAKTPEVAPVPTPEAEEPGRLVSPAPAASPETAGLKAPSEVPESEAETVALKADLPSPEPGEAEVETVQEVVADEEPEHAETEPVEQVITPQSESPVAPHTIEAQVETPPAQARDDVAAPPGTGEPPVSRSGRSHKRKRGRKDMPARIIRAAPAVVSIPVAPSAEAAGVPPSAPAADVAAPAVKVKTDADEAAINAKKKKKRDKVVEPETDLKKALKKKPVLRKKEVVDVSGLYADKNRGRKLRKAGRGKAQPPAQKPIITTAKAIKRRLKIDDTIALAELAKRMGIKAADIIRKLMDSGVMATMNQILDFDTAVLVAAEFDYELERAAFEEESILRTQVDDPAKLMVRPPVVTIMGHVDHGKTSLLDVIRKSRITEDEAGGITQHIGAYHVETSRGKIVFLDTPGHEAFTAMRSRGASVTDLVVLVVAADDGVMPQTHEAINHARAAGVPIIVAVNKMDKPGADAERVQRELADAGLLSEEWGGDTIFVKVSAKEKRGIDELLEMILLQAEFLELKANPEKMASGHVVEAKLDSGRGPVATVLIEDGTLHTGDAVVCGIYYGKVRALLDDRGIQVNSAGPAIPVEVIGLSGVPLAGDQLVALADEKDARQVSTHRVQKQRVRDLAKTNRLSLENLFEQIQEGNIKTLNLLIKADVHGSIEALRDSLLKLSNNEVTINVVHAATGTITESDVSLAAVSEAIIIGFNVRPTAKVQAHAVEEHVDIRYYNIIYNVIQDVQNAIIGMMASTFEARILGHAEVREVFHVPKIGMVAGCYITDGKVLRGRQARLLRDGVVIYEGKIGSLRRFKDDVKEVLSSYECGIGIENYQDIKVGDVIECYYMEELKPELQT